MAKILVVDDTEMQRFKIKKDLETGGHSVVDACDGADGLEKLAQNPGIELVITDINMPRMDGLTMCSKIRQAGKNPDLQIFMLTTESSPELKAEGKKVGVRAWLTKPHVAEKLLEAIGKVLRKP